MNTRFSVAITLVKGFNPIFWAWAYAGTALLSGITWGSLPWFAMDTASLVNTLVISFTVSGMLASSVSATASFLPAFLMFSIPAGGLLSVRFLIEGGMLAELSLLLLLFLVASIFFAISLNHIFRQSISQRFERDALLVDVEEKRRLAERAVQDKTRFLASASHDLRQPLHALDLYLSSMSRERDEQIKENLLNKARTSSRAVGELLNTLLDISGLDAGDTQPQCRELALMPLLEACLYECSPVAHEKDIVLHMRHTRELYVRTDPVLFTRMLRNLISNAIQYGQSGKVLIAARQRGQWVRVEVWDNGLGIAAEDLEYIFSEFHQVNNPERDRQKGFGLGLAIVRRLSQLLDHPVSVRSILGKGSCFRMLLPTCSPLAVMQAEVSDEGQQDIAGMFVLLVDDDAGILHAMRGWLRLRVCEVLAASSSVELLEKLKAGDYPEPNAIITDYRLRDKKTGLEVVQQVRRYYDKALPAIIVSGDTSKDVMTLAEANDCGFFAKPVAEGLLVHTLSKLKNKP